MEAYLTYIIIMAQIKTTQGLINFSWFLSFLPATINGFFWALISMFLNNASLLPITIDKNEFFDWKMAPEKALMWNAGLVIVFGTAHSAMISQVFKDTMASIWGGFAVLERQIFVWVSISLVLVCMLFYQPLPTVICDYYSPLSMAISYGVCLLFIVGLTFCNSIMGANDLFGFGRVGVMKPEGFEHPFNMPYSTHWIYNIVNHPIYWLLAFLFIGSGTSVTHGSLIFRGCFIVYTFVGANIENWRYKDMPAPKED